MKKFLALFLAVAMIFTFASAASFAEDGENGLTVVSREKIPDQALYQAILTEVNYFRTLDDKEAVEKLYYEDLDTVTQLVYNPFSQVGGQAVQNLTGVELCKNLQTIRLIHCPLASLQPLEQLSELTELYLSDCGITSLGGLLPLKDKLTALELSGNQISELSKLDQFSKLEYLSLADSELTSFDIPLPAAVAALDVSGNRIRDLSRLKERSSALTTVDISDNLIDMGDKETLALIQELKEGGLTVVNRSQLPKDGFQYGNTFTLYLQTELSEEELAGLPSDFDLSALLIQKLNGEVIPNQEFYLIDKAGAYEYSLELSRDGLIQLAKSVVKENIQQFIQQGQDIKTLFPDFTFEGATPTEEEIDAYLNTFLDEQGLNEMVDQILLDFPIENYQAKFTVGDPDPVESEDPDSTVSSNTPVESGDPDPTVSSNAPVVSGDPDPTVSSNAPVVSGDPDPIVSSNTPVESDDPDPTVSNESPVDSQKPDPVESDKPPVVSDSSVGSSSEPIHQGGTVSSKIDSGSSGASTSVNSQEQKDTGDHTNILALTILMLFSAGALAVLTVNQRKARRTGSGRHYK